MIENLTVSLPLQIWSAVEGIQRLDASRQVD
jgi:hypothetical protein